jgi:hypothetical protein
MPRAASLLFCALLVASLSAKLQHRGGEDRARAYPLAEGRAQTAAFLTARGFQVGRNDAPDSPFVPAARGDCHVVALAASPLGWDQDILPALAQPGDRTLFLFEGAAYASQPVWRTRADFLWRTANTYAGRTPPPNPVLAVLASAPCPRDAVARLTAPAASGQTSLARSAGPAAPTLR